MKIVVDSGSTKADWILFDEKENVQTSLCSLGLNPEVITGEEFEIRVSQLTEVKENKQSIRALYFYGSGCGTDRSKKMVYSFFSNYFPNAELHIYEDTYAAVFATTKMGERSIVCINGTGSNSSFFDGEELYQRVQSLGYIAMDDCSGSAFGRLMIKAYYLNIMPPDLKKVMSRKYDMDADVIKAHFYKMENPNAYLASFLPFLIEYKTHPFFKKMIVEQVSFFADYYIKQHQEWDVVPVHFVGSVAYFLQEEFREVLSEKGIRTGIFLQKPLDGLIEYHKQN